jgi:hypothetical protein
MCIKGIVSQVLRFHSRFSKLNLYGTLCINLKTQRFKFPSYLKYFSKRFLLKSLLIPADFPESHQCSHEKRVSKRLVPILTGFRKPLEILRRKFQKTAVLRNSSIWVLAIFENTVVTAFAAILILKFNRN